MSVFSKRKPLVESFKLETEDAVSRFYFLGFDAKDRHKSKLEQNGHKAKV